MVKRKFHYEDHFLDQNNLVSKFASLPPLLKCVFSSDDKIKIEIFIEGNSLRLF